MARYLARIIRAVIVSVLGLGGGIGLLTFIALVVLKSDQVTAVDVSIKTALVIGLCFGCFMAAVLLLTDLTMRLAAAQGNYEEIWDLEQTRVVELDGTLKEIRQLCRESLLVMPNLKSVAEENFQSGMLASTGNSWRSPGEQVAITFEQLAENKWKVKCVSRCTQKDIAYDYAKNYENVESWLKRLTKLADQRHKTLK
jgi:hypothetical protein